MPTEANDFFSNIHESDYNAPFLKKLIKSGDMIFDRGREREYLNGWWNFGIDQYDNCIRSKWYEERNTDEEGLPLPVDFSFEHWETIFVPSCWNMKSERYFLYEGSAVYTRTFNYKPHGRERVFFKFGAVNYEAKVFLNRTFIGMHLGGSTPFYIEATQYLKTVNRILVVADNTRKRTNVPCENMDWFNYGGIYRDVELFRLPETFIRDWTLFLVPDSSFELIGFSLAVDGPVLNGDAFLSIPGLSINAQIEVRDGRAHGSFRGKPELWTPQTPKLYDAVLTYGNDTVHDRVGFREIKTEGPEILLNGKPVFLRGISCHEESVKNGKAVSDTEIIENIFLAKELDCNFIRLAHYPHTQRTSEIADEMGIMLWEEIPVYWAIDFSNPGTYSDAENQLEELINRDKNRASVILWSIGNENPDTDERFHFMTGLAEKARETDPSRLISAACLVDRLNLIIADRLAAHLDVIGLNEYYGWYEKDIGKLAKIFENSRPSKPVIISEFGADARSGQRGTPDDLYTEDCQLHIYKNQLNTIGKIPSVKGLSPWILYDFRCPRRLHAMQGFYNIKGLLSADKKKKKLAFHELQDFYRSRMTYPEGEAK